MERSGKASQYRRRPDRRVGHRNRNGSTGEDRTGAAGIGIGTAATDRMGTDGNGSQEQGKAGTEWSRVARQETQGLARSVRDKNGEAATD